MVGYIWQQGDAKVALEIIKKDINEKKTSIVTCNGTSGPHWVKLLGYSDIERYVI